MRVGTYNVFKFRGFPKDEAAKDLGTPDGRSRISHFAEVFSGLRCDLLALQEGGVPTKMMWSIAEALNMELATINSPRFWPGHILSRYPIRESRTFSHFTPGDQVELLSRCCGAALIEVADRLIWVVALHLYPKDPELRRLEADLVIQQIHRLAQETEDILVLGDFNSNVHEPIHLMLDDLGYVNAMAEVGGGLRPTIDTAGKKKSTVDHIYVSPALTDSLKRASVVTTPGFRYDGPQVEGVWVHSDHLPVIAEFDL